MLLSIVLGIFALLLAHAQVNAAPLNSPLLDVYDYIVVGGGISGLVVANRLTEDPNVTVLVLEAGQADAYEEDIMVPVFVGADIYSPYDWYFQTLPQTYLDGARRRIPQGRALGGGSILNAMLWNRGGQGDYSDWEALGNPGWGWDEMLSYFMKSETFTPVNDPQIQDAYGIYPDPSVHGTAGPVNVSYQGYFYNTSTNFFQGLNYLGMPTVLDPNEASSAGATFLPLDLSPNNKSRADARRSYWDPYLQRDNFHVMTGQYVTKVVFEQTDTCANVQVLHFAGDSATGQGTGQGLPPVNGQDPSIPDQGLAGQPPSRFKRSSPHKHNSKDKRQTPNPQSDSGPLRAIGVQYAADAATNPRTVLARREVILAAGSLQSPKILELSGIGSSSILDQYNITTALHLPGVGENLQDHQLVGTYYQYYNSSYIYSNQLAVNATLNQLAMQEYYANRSGPWTAGPANGNAFPSLAQISNRTSEIVALARRQSTVQYLRQGLDSTVVAGFEAQLPLIIDALGDPNRAVIELLNSNAGNLSPSNMRPFSRGTSHIGSADPFMPPAIDPRYGSNPIDVDVLYESLLFNRRLLQTPPMAVLEPVQWAPPLDANETALRQFIANSVGTEYHPSGTCAMLPLNLGGVVDPSLLVYGTQNLRIVDASIQPIVPAAHLQAVVYGVAEKAADIIKAANQGPRPADPVLRTNSSAACSNGTASHTGTIPPFRNTTSVRLSGVPTASGLTSGTTTVTVLPSTESLSSQAPDTTTLIVTPSSSPATTAATTSMLTANDPASSSSSSLIASSDTVQPTIVRENAGTGPMEHSLHSLDGLHATAAQTWTQHHPTSMHATVTGRIDLRIPQELILSTTALMPPAPGPFAGYSPLAPTPVTPRPSSYEAPEASATATAPVPQRQRLLHSP